MTKGITQGEDPCEHTSPKVIEWMQSLGFKYTSDMGNGMMFNHKLFVKDDLHIFTDNAEFFYRESIKSRLEEHKFLLTDLILSDATRSEEELAIEFVQHSRNRYDALTTQLESDIK